MNAAQRLITLASAIDSRQGQERPFDAQAVVLDWIEHNEIGLAFDMLVDLLCEYDVLLFREEYRELRALHAEVGSEARQSAWLRLP